MSPKYVASRSYIGLSAEQLQAEAGTVAAQLAELRAQAARIQEQCMQLVAEQQAIADEEATQKLAGSATQDWAWVLAEDPLNSAVRYKAATAAVRRLAELDHHCGLAAEGVNAHTLQRVPKVSLLRGAPGLTRKVQAGLELLLPHIIPCKPGRSSTEVKYISVFEASLSEFGSYFLAIDESKDLYELRKNGYGSGRTVHEARSLGELLDYVELNCYYDIWPTSLPA